ncbi:MAG TPA: NAD(P)-dependent oxidoreductase [Chitinophaga sp.]
MSTPSIGWIGLGKMGIPMSQHLVKAGYPVTVYNRSKDKEESLRAVGAATAPTPGALLVQTDILFLMVSDDQAIHDLFNGPEGLLAAGAGGKIVINMSTVSPAVSREMAAHLQAQGNYYLDAPVSGSVKQAEDGALVIMVGGEEQAFETAKPVLEKIGRLALRVGDHGAGNTAKLAINSMLAYHAQGLAEAVLFAQANGIATEDLLTLINNSALGNPFIKIKGDAILKENYAPAFALKHIAKDLRLAKQIGLSSPLGQAAFNTFRQAEAMYGEEDIIAVIKQLK